MMLRKQQFGIRFSVPAGKKALIAARLRHIQGVVSASVTDAGIEIYYSRGTRVQVVSRYVRAFAKQYHTGNAVQASEMGQYRRNAIVSIGGFAVLLILKKTAPELFVALKVLRSLFVLSIAHDFIISGIKGLWQERKANADTLTATAVVASVLAGKPESSLTLLALSNGAEMLTSYAAERARRQISGILKLDQREVWVLENGHEKRMPVESVQTGQQIAVHLGEKICVDGRVLWGNAVVNQASITGESNPAIKANGAPVYAGTIVEAGSLVIQVEKVGKDTSLAHIIHLVEEAQTRRAPVQNFADRMANMLVPVSFLGAAIIYGATKDWQRVLNLLFIDFSCGLKLSTATAISAAIGVCAKNGILVKGGNYIESLANIDTVVLDKTGTITSGVPQISNIEAVPGTTDKEILLLAAAAELHSVHPLAVAIQRYVKHHEWIVPQHESSQTVVARGMRAVVPDFEDYRGGTVIVGSHRFMEEECVTGLDGLASPGHSDNVLYVARNKALLGVLTIHDPIRPQMKKTLNQMRRYGVDEIIMLTGDSHKVASAVAAELDIDSYHAEILPEDKADYVVKLEKHGNVMMVGDGINDAPALAFADVGVTLGGRQTDIAAESSAVTIHSEEPGRLIEALRIGHKTIDIINQNFMATILVNSIAMFLGALGKISPVWAAVIHNSATLAVVMNSVRILTPGNVKTRR